MKTVKPLSTSNINSLASQQSPNSQAVKPSSIKENLNGQSSHQSVNSSCSDSKLAYLENNLNRVCLQQDALMPLLTMVELMPVVAKCDSQLKSIAKKSEENEVRTLKVERILEQRLQEKLGKTPQHKAELVKLSRNYESLSQQFKDFEQNATNVHRWYEAKLKEEAYSVQRALDVKLEKQKQEIKAQLSRPTGGERQTDSVTRDELAAFKAELIGEVKELCLNRVEDLKEGLNKEIRNLYKEIGGLRCEVEYMTNLERKEKITQRLQQNPQSGVSQQLQINLMEQECFIEDLNSFNHENSLRIAQEIQSIRDDCHNISVYLTQPNHRQEDITQKAKEIEYLFEKNVNLKYQSAGTKKKFVNEMKKIEEKFIILEQIKEQINQTNSTPAVQSQLAQIKQQESRLGELMVSINRNLEQDLHCICELEEELLQLKATFDNSV